MQSFLPLLPNCDKNPSAAKDVSKGLYIWPIILRYPESQNLFLQELINQYRNFSDDPHVEEQLVTIAV